MDRRESLVRSDRKELAAVAPGFIAPSDSDFKVVLDFMPGEADWRLLETYSYAGLPYELLLEWSAGSATGALARITVPAAARVCVLARHLLVRAANLASEANAVAAVVGDAFAETRNFYEWRGHCDGAEAVQITVPRFATKAHLHVSDRSLLNDTVISLLDGTLSCRAQFGALIQPPGGIPLGAARRIDVLTAGAADVRALFSLSL